MRVASVRGSSPRRLRVRAGIGLLALIAAATISLPAAAYVGPGAGFALASSFLVVFTTILLAFLAILVWPFRKAWRLWKHRGAAKPHIKRFIVVGLDGQDPRITDRLMAEGKLPNFAKLAEQGAYRRLATTYPALSPVAWSSFSTGTNPGAHNIFDFLNRDRRTYLPMLSSTEIGKVEKTLNIGKWRIPLHKPTLRLLRKSKPFWSILGEHNIWSTVLRVPITFPPDEFYGAQLAAMCVPDLLGTQGTFLLFTTRPADAAFKEGGMRCALVVEGERLTGTVEGPGNTFLEGEPPMTLPLEIRGRNGDGAEVQIGGETVAVEVGELSDWVTIHFKAAPGMKVAANLRLQLTEMGEHTSLYVTPLNLDSEKPAMPISHPSYYTTYLAKEIGPFSTLGLAEDTWALNEKVTDDATFLQQSYDIDRERQRMFFTALDRLKRGALVCVFDATDRIQHMFWRYTEEGHPADDGDLSAPHRNAIEELYMHNDKLVGKVLEKVREGDVLCVISDHGFSSFRRGINLNAWLLREGYLALREGASGDAEWLRDVDWSRTKAYCLGLSGMFLNLEGREEQGIVAPGEAKAVKTEIIAKLNGLRDEEKAAVGIREVFDADDIYTGPYRGNAPDFIIGFNEGYRTSWDCATGVVSGPVFEDNTKAWSGDHCIDPRLVPGILFSSHRLQGDGDASILDLAPSILKLFGIEPPKHMEGRPLFDVADVKRGKAA